MPTLQNRVLAQKPCSNKKNCYNIEEEIMHFLVFLSVRILILGHSFGADCTQRLPELALEAGMDDVYVARFVKANCSLEEHWNYYQSDSTCFFFDCPCGQMRFKKKPCSIREAMQQEWDYVIFQNSLENEGRYETAQPYLNRFIEEFKARARENGHKVPQFGWNLFWPISKLLEDGSNSQATYRLSFYGNSSKKAWKAYKKCARKVLKKTEISFVIPVGAAIMDSRSSEYNTPEQKEFTRDGYHMSYSVGRYIAASAWYQVLLFPISGIEVSELPVGNAIPYGLKKIAQDAVSAGF